MRVLNIALELVFVGLHLCTQGRIAFAAFDFSNSIGVSAVHFILL